MRITIVAGVWFVDDTNIATYFWVMAFLRALKVLSLLVLATAAQTLIGFFGHQILAVRGKLKLMNTA